MTICINFCILLTLCGLGFGLYCMPPEFDFGTFCAIPAGQNCNKYQTNCIKPSECVLNATTGAGFCDCDRFENAYGTCGGSHLGTACSQGKDCRGGSLCGDDGMCVCPMGSRADGSRCKNLSGAPCTNMMGELPCPSNTICIQGICRCPNNTNAKRLEYTEDYVCECVDVSYLDSCGNCIPYTMATCKEDRTGDNWWLCECPSGFAANRTTKACESICPPKSTFASSSGTCFCNRGGANATNGPCP